jgi:hypothetical protein
VACQLFIKSSDGEIVKSVPVRVTTANHVTVTIRQNPEATQVILGHEYDIEVNIFNKDGRKIHPSDVKQVLNELNSKVNVNYF